ncbi:MAG: glycosyltransferase family 39 protein [Chloroflexota bacterium]
MTVPTLDDNLDRIPARALLWLALIVLLAALLRLPNLQSAPVGGHGDVAWVGLNALDWVDRGVWPFYIREMYSPEFPVVYLNGLLLPFTGISYLSPRLITAFTGLLFVAFLFPATWWLLAGKSRVFRERASLLAALSAAVSLHAMYLSRLGMESPPFLAALTLLVWLTAWAWQRGGWWRWALAGAALGFAQYIYLPARLLPLMLFLWIVYTWWADRDRLRMRWRGWLVMALVSFVVTLPALILFITVPGSFSGRADTGTAITGGWVWAYDSSAEGGLLVLIAKKIALTLLAFGVYWNGPYTIMGQPMLGPLFFIGFVIAIGALIRNPRQIAYAWPALAIPVMLLTDLISGTVVEIHALHQMGVLPFVFILSGCGLAIAWQALETHILSRANVRRPALAGLVLLAVAPGMIGTYRYLRDVIPAQYADPETGWRTEQIDVDMSRHIIAAPDRAYLVPYAEYSRSNVAWLLSDAFRERRSAINADGILQLPPLPDQITLVKTDLPERPRHDGRPSKDDARLWVLLYKGQTWFLPPLTADQDRDLAAEVATQSYEPLRDRSNTEIAQFYTFATPTGLFAPRPVIDTPLDATFNGEIQLKGYTVQNTDLTPGSVLFVTLYWQAKVRPSEDYNLVAQIWNDAKESLASTTDFPFGGAYRTRIWRPDEIVATQHWLQLPDKLPAARYTLAVTMTHLLGSKRLPTTGANADPALQIALAPDLRVPMASVTELGTPPPQAIQFGDVFSVTGIDAKLNDMPQPIASTWTATPGQTLTVNIVWSALKRPPSDYSVFLHLSAAADSPPLAQADLTMGGAYPTGAWRTGDKMHDQVTLSLPATLPAGEYKLYMGVYFWQTNKRLPLLINDAPMDDAQWQIGTLKLGR